MALIASSTADRDRGTEPHRTRLFVAECFRLASDEKDVFAAAAKRFHHAQHLRGIKIMGLKDQNSSKSPVESTLAVGPAAEDRGPSPGARCPVSSCRPLGGRACRALVP